MGRWLGDCASLFESFTYLSTIPFNFDFNFKRPSALLFNFDFLILNLK